MKFFQPPYVIRQSFKCFQKSFFGDFSLSCSNLVWPLQAYCHRDFLHCFPGLIAPFVDPMWVFSWISSPFAVALPFGARPPLQKNLDTVELCDLGQVM